MQSRVAVIIRTKNRGSLLGRALDSVLAQTYSDWQIVLVNDGGHPGDVDEALTPRLGKLGDKLLRLDNETSIGMEAASNLGIHAATSEFIAIHDDDDEWDPDFLATTVAYLDQHPNHGGVSVETEIVFERLTRNGREVEERVPFEPQMREITLVDLLHYNRFVPISFLFRRAVYDELGGFDEKLPVVGDWEFHLRFLVHHQIGLLKGRPLAFWNQRRTARDSEANSVISGLDDHHFYSHQVRDRLLREHAREHGIGPLLYQRELLAAETTRIHQRIDDMQRHQAETSEHINRLLGEVEHLQGSVWKAAQPLSLRAARSVKRRLTAQRLGPRPALQEFTPSKETGPGQSIAVLADVGQKQYHVGDEAMAHAAIEELRARGFSDFVVLTHDADQTSRLFDLPVALRPEVPWNAYERHVLLQEIKATLQGEPGTEAAATVIGAFQESFSQCHSLLIAGGGNLTSQYGGLLFERLAAIHVAHSMGLKVVISGQTVGPVLTEVDRAEVAEALRLCAAVGSREAHTHDLLSTLGLASFEVLDDASFMAAHLQPNAGLQVPPAYIAATFAPGSGAMHRDDYLRLMARLLDQAHERLGLPVVLLPHVSTIGESDGDQDCHHTIARLAKTADITVLEQMTAHQTAALTARAQLVVTSRYHPVVFALSAAVPVLPVAVDYYGEVRIGGALDNWGVKGLLRSLRHLGEGADTAWVHSIIEATAEVREHLEKHNQGHRNFHGSWWDYLADLMSGSGATENLILPTPDSAISMMLGSPEGQTAERLNASNEVAIGLLAQHGDWLQGRVHELERQVASGRAASRELRGTPSISLSGLKQLTRDWIRQGR